MKKGGSDNKNSIFASGVTSLLTNGKDKSLQKSAGNSIQQLGSVDPITGYANENFGNKYLDYRPASELKAEQSAQDAQATKDAQAATDAANIEDQRKRLRNSIFQTEGTGGVLTNSVSARQSYFGN
jgi:hypothetical protein